MELSGPWRATPADDEVRRDGVGVDVDDSSWLELPVPGHWQDHPELASSDGPILYRRRFQLPPPADGQRRWVTLDGVFYQADVWLDGAYLGDPEGYFFPHSFDVTALSRMGDEHQLAIEVTCQPERGIRGRRNVTGLFQHSEAVDHAWNPGGLWRPVLVYDTGPAKLDRLRVLCRDADDARAHLRLYVRLDSDEALTVRVRTTSDGTVVGETEHPVAAGTNEIEWSLDIDRPELWWPRALGGQPLTDIDVELLVDGVVSDRRSRRTGLREVAWNDWVCSVNGERIFLKAANVMPTRPGLANTDLAAVRRDVELAVEAGLDALRVQAHIAHPELYRAADELGVLLLQDFPLQWGYSRHIRRTAVHQAREAVNALGHHPAIVQWCAHDEPVAEAPQVEPERGGGRMRRFIAQQLPSWNKTVLDRWLRRAFEQADPTRPTVAHSGVAPHLPQFRGTDSHLWLGWTRGQAADLADRARLLPSSVRFVSEFGAQSVPDSALEFVDASSWPDLDWEELREHHGLDVEAMLARVPPGDHATFGSWRVATQRYQAEVLRTSIEILRRLKYRPTGGFAFSWLADPGPMISVSVLDHHRQPKLAWTAAIEACRPVIVVTDPLPATIVAGERLDLDVHVVNDRREDIIDAWVSVTATWRSGRRQWAFRGDAEADSVAFIGRLRLDVPEQPGELLLAMTLIGDDDNVVATRRAATMIVMP